MKIDLAGYRKTEQPLDEEPAFEEAPVDANIAQVQPDEPDTALSFNDSASGTGEESVSSEAESFSTLEPPDDIGETAPEPSPEDFAPLRNKSAAAETIALSLREPLPEPVVPPPPAVDPAPAPPVASPVPPPEPEDRPAREEQAASGVSKIHMAIFAALFLIVVGLAVWSQWGFVSGLIGLKPSKHKPAAVVRPAQTLPAAPVPVAIKTDSSVSDPTISALAALKRAVPRSVWLTAVTLTSECAYSLKGMSFSHDAMTSFASSLSSAGSVASSDLPARVASPEHVYPFAVAGKLNGISPMGVLDVIPPDRMVALGDSLRAKSKSLGVTFVRLPRANAKYGENDLPFEAAGTYDAVMSMIDGLAASGRIAVNRISVIPAVSGGSFNRIRAGFSLRSVSAL